MKIEQIGTQRRAEIIRLYTTEKLGLKAICRYMSDGITLANIRSILVESGVYEGIERPMQMVRERRDQVVRDEKERRQRMAVCLWQLRNGVGVETTCRRQGWNRKSIWNDLRTRQSYWRLKGRLEVKYPQNRVNHRRYEWVSRTYSSERAFADHIAEVFTGFGIAYEREPGVKAALCRADFRIFRTLVECKSDVTTAAMNKALGQSWIYKVLAGEDCIVVIPDDVHPRKEWLVAFEKMGVRLFPESALVQMLSGELPLASVATRSALRSRRSLRDEGAEIGRGEQSARGGRPALDVGEVRAPLALGVKSKLTLQFRSAERTPVECDF